MAIVAREIPFSTSVTHPRSAPLWSSNNKHVNQRYALRGVLLVACDRISERAIRSLSGANWVSAFASHRPDWLRLVVAGAAPSSDYEEFDRCLSDLRQGTARAASAQDDKRVLGESVILLSADESATANVVRAIEDRMQRFDGLPPDAGGAATLQRWVLQFQDRTTSFGPDDNAGTHIGEIGNQWNVLRCHRTGTQQQAEAELVNGLIPFVSGVAACDSHLEAALRGFAKDGTMLAWETHFDATAAQSIQAATAERAKQIADKALAPLGDTAQRNAPDSERAGDVDWSVEPVRPASTKAPVKSVLAIEDDEQPTIAQATGSGTINLALAGAIAALCMLAYAVFATPAAGGGWTAVSVWGAFLVIIVLFIVAWIALGARAGYQLAATPDRRPSESRAAPVIEIAPKPQIWPIAQVKKSARNQSVVDERRIRRIAEQRNEIRDRWAVGQVGTRAITAAAGNREASAIVILELDCTTREATITHLPYKLTLRGARS